MLVLLLGMSNEDIFSGLLFFFFLDYENIRNNSVGGESGIDMDGIDEGYVDDVWMDFLFFFCEEYKFFFIEMDKVKKVLEVKVMLKGLK